MLLCSDIGVEDVKMPSCTDPEDFCPSAVPRLRGARTKTRSVSGSCHGGIGVEDVQLQFYDDVEGFCSSTVPRGPDTQTKPHSVSGSEDPLSCRAHRGGDHTSADLRPTEIVQPCVPQLLGQVRELRSDQDGAESRTAFEVNGSILRGVQTGVVLRWGARLLEKCCGLRGYVLVIETHGPPWSLHLTQLERGSQQKVACFEPTLQLI